MQRYQRFFVLMILVLCAVPLFAGGQGEAGGEESSLAPGEVKLTVWAIANPPEEWRANVALEAAETLNAELAAEGSETRVVVEAINDSSGWTDYKRKFTLAAESGSGPDIVTTGHSDVATWSQAGYIVPLADSVEEIRAYHPNFDDVIPSLWNAMMWNGQVWAVPQDVEARPLFFNKTKLAQLGWSTAEIESLPDRIADGRFTLDDMIQTAEEAVQQGIVEPGFGFYHRPSKGSDFLQYYRSFGGEIADADAGGLVVNSAALRRWFSFQREVVERGITPDNFIGTAWNIWHDAVSHGNALFFNGGIWHWSEWSAQYVAELGGKDYLAEHFGYALQPAGTGGRPNTLSNPLAYMVTSAEASGNNHQELAKRLVAHMTTAELNTRHALMSTHLGVVRSQMDYPPYTEDQFLSDVTYMLDYTTFQPNHPMYGVWFDIVWSGMVAAQQGEKTPEQAADDVIEQLQFELGDMVSVR